MPAIRVTSLVGRCLTALLVAGVAADAACAFFPSLPPTNRVLPTGGGGPPTTPNRQMPPGSPPPPAPPSTQSGTPGGPPSSSPPGVQGPPAPPVIPPSSGITPTPPSPPGPIPEISVHGLAAGLALTLCGLLMLTDRKRRKGLPPTPGR